MDTIFSAGILGNLKFDYHQHTWAIEVGQFLGCVELLLNDSRDDSGLNSTSQLAQVANEINRRLSDHHISYQLPDIPPGANVHAQTIVNQTLVSLKNDASSAHCAFALIGEGACFLREGIRAASTDQLKEAVAQTALNRLKDIQRRCPEITLAIDSFWQLLTSHDSESLDTTLLIQILMKLEEPLRIHLLAASPSDQDRLELPRERRELIDSIERTRLRDNFRVDDSPSCRVRDINRDLLRFNPTILHFQWARKSGRAML